MKVYFGNGEEKCRRQRRRSARKTCISELHHKYQILYHSGIHIVVVIEAASRSISNEKKMNSRGKFFYPAEWKWTAQKKCVHDRGLKFILEKSSLFALEKKKQHSYIAVVKENVLWVKSSFMKLQQLQQQQSRGIELNDVMKARQQRET